MFFLGVDVAFGGRVDVGEVDKLEAQASPAASAVGRVAFQHGAAAGRCTAGSNVEITFAVDAEGGQAVESQVAELAGNGSRKNAPRRAECSLELRHRINGVVDLELLVRSRVGNQEAILGVNDHSRGNNVRGKLDLLGQPLAACRETDRLPPSLSLRPLQDPNATVTIHADAVGPLDLPGAKRSHALGAIDLDRAIVGTADEQFR